MHRTFGRYYPIPNLMFEGEEEQENGGGGDDAGYPANTAVKDMTTEQQAAYWKAQSRKHEARSKARDDYDQFKADSEELRKLREASQSEQEKALQQAREEARREGENLGASRYLTDAIRADLGRSTGKTNEELAAVMAVIDTSKFVTTAGDIDSEKLTEFAKSFGIATPGPAGDPVRDAFNRTKTPPAGSSGSVNQRRAERREELAKR